MGTCMAGVDPEILKRAGAGSLKRQFRRNFQNDKQKVPPRLV